MWTNKSTAMVRLSADLSFESPEYINLFQEAFSEKERLICKVSSYPLATFVQPQGSSIAYLKDAQSVLDSLSECLCFSAALHQSEISP